MTRTERLHETIRVSAMRAQEAQDVAHANSLLARHGREPVPL